MPEAVLAEHWLAKILQTLKQMTRLPKKERLINIFDSMQDMVAKADVAEAVAQEPGEA